MNASVSVFETRLAEPEADAADVSPALFEFFDFWSKAFEAACFESGLELWGASGHDDGFASADEIAGKTIGAFLLVDENFIEVRDGFEL